MNPCEETILVNLFGLCPETKIISFFMDFPLNDFMQKEVCETTGLNPRTVSKRLSKFNEIGILRVTRKVGKATFYQLDGKHAIVKKIKELVETTSFQNILSLTS
ncbi:MAG: helix-turn-helix domain-containing protein [Candidatus Thorarchaeota archaeon]